MNRIATNRIAANRIAANRTAANRIALGLAVLLALFSAACSSTDNAQNTTCVTPAGSRFAWVYYPGYGCGPLTPTGRGPFGG